MKKRLSLLWILVLVFIIPSDLSAANQQDSIGSVVAIRGTVTASGPEGAVRKLALKSPVYQDDTLKTGKRSRLQVMFIDNTIVSLGPNSEMIIAEYQWQPDQNDGGMKTKVKEGVFRIMGGAITKVAPDKFTTETPAATIGIRGSMYAGRVTDGALTVVFQGGRGIYVTNPAGTVDISTPGYGTRVEGISEAPETPQPFTAEEITNLNNEISASGNDSEQEEPSKATDENDNSGTGNSSSGGADEPGADDTQDATDQPADPQPQDNQDNDNQGAEDGSLLAANTSSSEIDASAQAESLTSGVSNDLGNEVNTDSGTTDTNFIDTLNTISDSLATVQDTLNDSVQDDLNETEVAPAVAEASDTEETTVVDTATDETTTTTTIIAVETTTTTTTTTIETVTTTDPPSTPAPTIAHFSGKYLAVQFDMDTGTNAGDAIWSGDTAPTSTDGLVDGSVTANEDSKEIPYQFQIATYDDSGTYTGASTGSADHTVNLEGQDRTFTNGADLHWSDLGEFVIFHLPETDFDSGNYKFQELGFAGVPTSSLPSDGVENYSGHVLVALTDSVTSNIDADTATFEMEANWHNGKVLGRIDSTDSGIIFFGDVVGTTVTAVQFFGQGKYDSTPTAVDGTVDFAQFYGSQHQGVGVTASGNTYAVNDVQADVNSWSATGAGFRVYENPLNDPVAPTGIAQYDGFVTGRADDMDTPTVNRRLFLSGSSDFQLTIDQDAGTISGTLNADDALLSGYQIAGMTVGGGNGSAYVLQDNFGAGLGGGGGVIANGGNTGSLKSYGNYMVSAHPNDQFSEYVTWGYWEAAYVDPVTGTNHYHIIKNGSYWIAGVKTPVGTIQDAITNTQFLGTYQGPAYGIGINGAGTVTQLTGGATDITIDFGLSGAANQIAGSINFDQINFAVAGATVTSAGFTATLTNADTSTVNGAYYGPSAEAIGGNFHADVAGDQYLGIFGGNKIP